MILRAVHVSDLEECFHIEPRHLGNELLNRTTAVAVWTQIMQTHAFNSTVIQDTLHGREQIIAFGASVFCQPEFMDEELRSPRPFLNSRILHKVYTGRTAIVSDAQMLATGASTAMDLFLLSGCFRQHGPSVAQLREAQMLLPLSLAELHKGYPIRKVFTESISAEQDHFIEISGFWERNASFPEASRALWSMTEATVFRTSGAVCSPLFQYKAPLLGLRTGERQLLAAAVHGATDQELAADLHLSAETVKKRWTGIFERVALTRPVLLGEARELDPSPKRGTQKRHRVLAYVRTHPEEVRPFRWYPQS